MDGAGLWSVAEMDSIRFRIIKAIGERGLWKRIGRVHTWIYRTSGGRVGHAAGGMSNLLLTTTGRQSGAPRTVPLTYLADGDDLILVASNGGNTHHPAWWLNLAKQPRAEVQVGTQRFNVVASQAEGEERTRLWQAVTRYNPMYAEYEKMTKRRIPVVVLRRA